MLDDQEILSVNSPRSMVEGPYTVVYKTEYWAIVTLDYEDAPSLGIRWFDDGIGTPTSHGYPTWFIIPDELRGALLYNLPLKMEERSKIVKFLAGDLEGAKLGTK